MAEDTPRAVVQHGGFRLQQADPGEHTKVPPAVQKHQLEAKSEGYREQAIKDGIPFRKAGLFPPADPFLTELAGTSGLHPFEKHLPGMTSPYEIPKKGSWVSGNAAAEHGFDLRLFYQGKKTGSQYGTVIGAARLGDRASIGNGYWMGAHGGAIESLLDEATAELAKMEIGALMGTIEAHFKIKKPVPLHTTVRIDCKVVRVQGLRSWVSGTIKMPGTDVILATCDAQLVDLAQLYAAQK